MIDRTGRDIDYMRVSITDRCDLRCKYCMPCPLHDVPHVDILRYEEMLRVCRAAMTLGINKFKVTGGEPFARKGAAEFIARLKAQPGVECVTVTTNGTMLSGVLPGLIRAGIDGINISIDAADAAIYKAITGFDHAGDVLAAVAQCAQSGIKTKVNCVMLDSNLSELVPLAALARDMSVDVRFIELMPLGYGQSLGGPDSDAVLERLKTAYPDLRPADEKRGNGPAVYYASDNLKGRIGFISANSHKFCASCNRIRLTSTGMLKPCLCYDAVADLRELLRNGASDEALAQAIAEAVYAKPSAHCFSDKVGMTEHRMMNEIGG
jgi:cyclic pyranopterin phosphate synthase